MERKRFSILFFIKRSKLLKNGEAPLRVRVTYDKMNSYLKEIMANYVKLNKAAMDYYYMRLTTFHS
ncbi:MAG: hypothetical protein LBG15_09500 [Dysgonamonadaceae bacterium]|jgi:hypothetical protein|nr:hypothetical protein [Dysgonamonadaceae bacterium]